MDIYGLAGVHLKNPNYGLGYTDAEFFRAEQNAMVRNWLARLKRIRLKSLLPRSVRGVLQGRLAQAHPSR